MPLFVRVRSPLDIQPSPSAHQPNKIDRCLYLESAVNSSETAYRPVIGKYGSNEAKSRTVKYPSLRTFARIRELGARRGNRIT